MCEAVQLLATEYCACWKCTCIEGGICYREDALRGPALRRSHIWPGRSLSWELQQVEGVACFLPLKECGFLLLFLFVGWQERCECILKPKNTAMKMCAEEEDTNEQINLVRGRNKDQSGKGKEGSKSFMILK